MDLSYTPEERAFRDRVRAFVRDNLPAAIADKVRLGRRLHKSDFVTWQHILYRQGWAAPGWPEAYGGTGWNAVQRHIFEEECAAADAPPVIPFGLKMVAPVIMAFGSPQQKDYFLPRILSSEDWWCQGYSEPGAGSDLAALKTRAERDGDHYIVNGQKTWTTLAQHADWIFCLVRTDPEAKKQEGISFLLIDMHSPGVSVRPIVTIDGDREINEVFFDSVRVPATNRVGDENKGWTYAKYLLTFERTGIAGVGESKQQLRRLKAIAGRERRRGRPLIEDPAFRARAAALEIELMALEMTNLRVLAAEKAGAGPGAESSLLKIQGTEIQQALTELMLEAVGAGALAYQPDVLEGKDSPLGADYAPAAAPHYFNWRKASIYGGSNEIQKNIIAKHVLGL